MQAQKKIKQTDAIFTRLHHRHAQAAEADNVLRLSLDTKATVKIGLFSRGGHNWVEVKGLDHDFKPEATLSPFGILVPRYQDLFLYFARSRITSDFIVDMLEHWWEGVRGRFPRIDTLLLNQDNGPENHSRRTQLLKRIVAFGQAQRLTIRLAYYPPYHSKYNAIEHCWGVLENHWNGELLDENEAVLGFARTMTWNAKNPEVELVSKIYRTGIRLSPAEMKVVEQGVTRDADLGKWFLDIDGRKLKVG